MPLGEIAERSDLPKSGAHRLLATLVDLGWAEQDRETGFYRLTMRLAVLGQRFYVGIGPPGHLPAAARPFCARLPRVRAACRRRRQRARVDRARARRHGRARPRVSAGGDHGERAALRHRERQGVARDADVDARDALPVRDGGFAHADDYGPNVIRSIDALLRDLRTTARRGYGVALNEAEPGVTAIAAAIRSGPEGAAVGTVSIAGPTVRVDGQARPRTRPPGRQVRFRDVGALAAAPESRFERGHGDHARAGRRGGRCCGRCRTGRAILPTQRAMTGRPSSWQPGP